ncbi:zinc finger MYM-type protein 1-like [Ambystoma mexicanum]|uniref:zinc finger MYM-type protein 1-like n=1 Tax=Ambystoma mexicanum TaxID=8296 RepID=UPI0037E7D17D
MNSVDQLLSKPFSGLAHSEKLEVKRLGPDRPDVKIEQSAKDRGKAYTRTFSMVWYEKKTWLTGSIAKRSLFCFPCLLFGGETAWTKTGVTDLKHLSEKTKRHESCKSHIENILQLRMLGSVNIATQLDDAYRRSVMRHNEDVDKNRYILSKLIDCVRFCGAFELALRGHDETEDSLNPGVFRGLVDFVSSIDSAMELHLKNATVFKGTSKTIQNELLDCMHTVTREIIVEQLKCTDYVAIQADDTTDISTKTQSVLVYRYIDERYRIVERFYGFSDLKDSSAQTIATAIMEKLDKVFPEDCHKKKVIAQTYDGASVMRGVSGGVQKKVAEVYPNAHYVHCYAHQLNLIIEQSVSNISQARVFFLDISGFCTFFSRSPKRTAVLDEVSDSRLPKPSRTRWSYHIRVVEAIYRHREALRTCFEKIIERRTDFEGVTVHEAQGFIRTLKEKEFLFFLFLFNDIMPHVDILYNQLQKRDIDSVYVQKATETFIKCIGRVRESTDNLEAKFPSEATFSGRNANMNTLNRLAKEVCDIIVTQAQERFAFTNHLEGAKLLQSDLFQTHGQSFPNDALNATVQAYPMLNKERLRTELSIVYERPEFCSSSGAISLLKLFVENNLEEAFSETMQLLKILITTPMTTAESERCFSTLKRIKTFLRNTMTEDRLNALAMLSMEKQLIQEIPDFNTRTIDKFASLKNRRAQFVYKLSK